MSEFQNGLFKATMFWLVLFLIGFCGYLQFVKIKQLQTALDTQTNGIVKTTQILNRSLANDGKIDINALRAVGWNISKQPNDPPQQ